MSTTRFGSLLEMARFEADPGMVAFVDENGGFYGYDGTHWRKLNLLGPEIVEAINAIDHPLIAGPRVEPPDPEVLVHRINELDPDRVQLKAELIEEHQPAPMPEPVATPPAAGVEIQFASTLVTPGGELEIQHAADPDRRRLVQVKQWTPASEQIVEESRGDSDYDIFLGFGAEAAAAYRVQLDEPAAISRVTWKLLRTAEFDGGYSLYTAILHDFPGSDEASPSNEVVDFDGKRAVSDPVSVVDHVAVMGDEVDQHHWSEVAFTFSAPPTLQADTPYWVVLTVDRQPDDGKLFGAFTLPPAVALEGAWNDGNPDFGDWDGLEDQDVFRLIEAFAPGRWALATNASHVAVGLDEDRTTVVNRNASPRQLALSVLLPGDDEG